MGQCYTVQARLSFPGNDPRKFCEIIRAEVEARTKAETATFNVEEGSFDTPAGCLKILAPNVDFDEGDQFYYADFNASYGWGCVMEEIFKAAAEALDEGGYIQIGYWEGDISTTTISKTGGAVVVKDEAFPEEDDEDYEAESA